MSQVTPVSTQICVIYSYYEKNDQYRNNMVYFLKYGYVADPNVDFVVVVNGAHTVQFPYHPNLKVIQRENEGFDFQGYYLGVCRVRKNTTIMVLSTPVREDLLYHHMCQPTIVGIRRLLICVKATRNWSEVPSISIHQMSQ
jgi:hypothetical protein